MSNTILTGEAAADILAAMQKAGLNGWEMFVPEGVEEIAPGAFAGMKNLRRVQLPKTLRRIGAAAFYGCGNLAQIALPAGLVELGTAAFKNSGFQEISIPPRVARLGGEVFADSALRCAEIKGRQTGASMFRGCWSADKSTAEQQHPKNRGRNGSGLRRLKNAPVAGEAGANWNRSIRGLRRTGTAEHPGKCA